MPFRWQAWHVVGLWSLALAQPLLDTVARNGEFLVAHRADATDVALLAASLVLLVPAVPLAAAWLLGRLAAGLQHAAVIGLLYAAAASIGLQALEHATSLPMPWIAVVAGGLSLVFVAGYATTTAVRTFTSLVALAVVIVPATFLGSPSIRKFWIGREPAATVGRPIASKTPIVVVVFDQLPLASLMGGDGGIDARLYPSFAALAQDGIWFRNATAVAERTGTGLPAILTGRYPRPHALPSAVDHPQNLFTWLGRSYEVHASEPITSLCPVRVCGASLGSRAERARAVLSDLSTVYLRIAAPRELESLLPPVNQNWRDFDVPRWQREWRRRTRSGRQESFRALLDAVASRTASPALYFAHVLLPHEPFVYLPSGRRYEVSSRPVFGHVDGERWTSDPWPVLVAYQRELLQIAYVDRLLGLLITRLRTAGLYDRALIVVTSDHGAAFVPGEPFKDPTPANVAEIAAVPLILKLPGQREAGRVDDTNTETIDVMPTIAAVLEEPLPWRVDGSSAMHVARRERKKVFSGGGAMSMEISPHRVAEAVRAAARRKYDLFGDPPDLYRVSGGDRAWSLVGRRVADIPAIGGGGVAFSLDDAGRYTDVDPRSGFVPALVYGKTASIGRQGPGALVAVAIDGIVRTVARTFYAFTRVPGAWMAVVPESALREGLNRVEVYEVLRTTAGALALRRTGARSPSVSRGNLLDRAAGSDLGVRASGFYPEESAGGSPFRWTRERAQVEIPYDAEHPPGTLTVGVTHGGPPGRRFAILADGCVLYRGASPPSGWRRTFPLGNCGLGEPAFTVSITADSFVPGNRDRRRLGIALGFLSLRSR